MFEAGKGNDPEVMKVKGSWRCDKRQRNEKRSCRRDKEEEEEEKGNS